MNVIDGWQNEDNWEVRGLNAKVFWKTGSSRFGEMLRDGWFDMDPEKKRRGGGFVNHAQLWRADTCMELTHIAHERAPAPSDLSRHANMSNCTRPTIHLPAPPIPTMSSLLTRRLVFAAIITIIASSPLLAHAQSSSTTPSSLDATASATISTQIVATSSSPTPLSIVTASTSVAASGTDPLLGARLQKVPWRGGHAAAFVDPWMIIYGGAVDPSANYSSTTLPGSASLNVWNVNGSWYGPLPNIQAGSPSMLPQLFHQAVALPSQGQALMLVSNTTNQDTKGTLQALDTNHWSWAFPAPSVQVPRRCLAFSTEIVNNTVFMYGGIQVDNLGNPIPNGILNSLSTLDVGSYSWSQASNGPTLAYHSTCYMPVCNCLITFGGTPTGDSTNVQNRWDWDDERRGADIVESRRNSRTLTIQSLALGLNHNNRTFTSTTSPTQATGNSTLLSRPRVAQHPAHAEVTPQPACRTRTIWSCGGSDTPFDDDVWILDVSKGSSSMSWSRVNTNKQQGPGVRMGHTAVRAGDNLIYIFGGWGPAATGDTNVYLLNTTSWVWTTIPANSGWPVTPASTDVGTTSATPSDNVPQTNEIPPITQGGSSSQTWIIVGCVVGAVVLGALMGFGLVYRRRRASKKSDDIDAFGSSSGSGNAPGTSRGMSMPPFMHGRNGSSDPLANNSGSAIEIHTPGESGAVTVDGSSSFHGSFIRAQDFAEKDATAAALAFGVLPPVLSKIEQGKGPRIQELGLDLGEAASYVGALPNALEHANESKSKIDLNQADPPSRAIKLGQTPRGMEALRRSSTPIQQPPSPSPSSPASLSHTSVTSPTKYPVGYVPDEEDEADNWTFASSLSFDGSGPPPIRYIPPSGSSRRFSTTTVSSSPSALLYASKQVNPWGASVTLTQGSVPIARPVTPPSAQIALPRAPIHGYHGVGGGPDALGLSIYDSVSPLDRLATLGYEDEETPAVPPIPSAFDDRTGKARLDVQKQTDANHSLNSSVDGSSVQSTDMSGKTPFPPPIATTNQPTPRHTTTSTSPPEGLAHPVFASLVAILPPKYKPDPARPPILGPANAVLFAHDARASRRRDVTVKAFGRREAWERECRVLTRLRALYVVDLIEVLTLEDTTAKDEVGDGGKIRYVTVMERLDETLANVLRSARKAMKEREREREKDKEVVRWDSRSCVFEDEFARGIVRGVLECLGWCHTRGNFLFCVSCFRAVSATESDVILLPRPGIAFCDLKPSNIMHNFTDSPSQWKLIDFEGSRAIGEECVGVITPRYCPPEVARATTYGLEGANGVVATASVDMWALGCVLYELQTGRPLFPNSITDSTILHFISHPSPSTPALNNGMHWNEMKELEIPNFERLVRHEDARRLIKTLLSCDPSRRGTVVSVLKSPYLNPIYRADPVHRADSPRADSPRADPPRPGGCKTSFPSAVTPAQTAPIPQQAVVITDMDVPSNDGESSRKN
ncbi:hypothetical protein BC938DRAFT_481725 [Jimgerdemannia flammicorona]|uniref:Protein kinase domain-containing protein n=1 Tax=Jimgerdemannia flammicorona TaxID=994334 RepID=A0A433QFI5_9FUNG|nr:hypothetical protein BC938DRAFT_481725 [Jimgerdemannia flammicorona]